MASILFNTKSFIDFYILDDRITAKNKRKIRKTSKFFNNFSVRFIDVNTDRHFAHFPDLPKITRAMYSRYLIPELMPNLEKAIYSDIDVAFMADIKELYDMDLNGHIIGAVTSYRNKENINNYPATVIRLGLKDKNSIFASGLLLINCSKWKKNNVTEELMHLTNKLNAEQKLRLPDMDTLNKFFDGEYLPIDKTWCLIHKALKLNFEDAEIKKLIANQKIAHFSGGGRSKPWNNRNIEGAEYFWKYVPYTAFRKDIERINLEFNNLGMRKHYRRKYLNILIKIIVSKRKYRKLKKDPALFFSDSKNSFIKFLGRLYL